MSNIEPLLFFTNAQKVLSFFLKNPTGRFYDREMARLTGVSRAGTNFALRDLVKAGLLDKEKKGRMVFYCLRSNPLAHQLKIVQNLVSLLPLVEQLKPFCRRIVLFGSAARGLNGVESDWDLFVLTSSKEKVVEILAQHSFPNPLHPMVHTPQEWIRLEDNEVFTKQIEKGITLWEFNEPGI